MGVSSEAAMERPAIVSGRVDGLPVEQHFRLVQKRHGIDFIPIIRVEEDRFEGKRADGKPIRCLELFDRTPRLVWFTPVSAQCSPPVSELQEIGVPTGRRHNQDSSFSGRQSVFPEDFVGFAGREI